MKSSQLRYLALLSAIIALATALHAAGPVIVLNVDATQAPLKILHARMEMQVKPGPLTLYYPKWIPGLHEPAGPIANVTGLNFKANGKTVPWRRDLLDVFTFHVDIPPGASRLEVAFDYLESGMSAGPAAGSATNKLLVFTWNQALLYPAGIPAAQLVYAPTLRLPAGWKFGSALALANQAGSDVVFQPVTLERLVDSPVIAGQYFRAFDITPPGDAVHHEVDFVADSEAALAMSPETQQEMRQLIAETGKMFGARHYREYHFLVALSDQLLHFGIEHHESSENRLGERELLSPDAGRGVGSLLAHEFAHSWCGKYRRPANMSTPDYQTPMETDLLWVYEGATTFLGDVLAVRSGLTKADDFPQHLANTAADMGPGTPGRRWRSLLDTAVSVPGMFRGGGFGNWRRGSDYYPEGDLLWLEVATIIQGESGGRKSLEDFLRAFFGGANNGPEVKPYTAADVIRALNEVVPYDWSGFFEQRVASPAPDTPTGGILRSGWKLVWDQPAPGEARQANPEYSIGLSVGRDGTVMDSIYDGPAFKAGVVPGMKVLGINGRIYRPDYLNDAIAAAKTSAEPIQLLVVSDEYISPRTIDYHEGPKSPRLVRDPSKPDLLNEMLKPLAKAE